MLLYYPSFSSVDVGGVSKMLKFYIEVFYVMGKALSGELPCPCDRSCYISANFLQRLMSNYQVGMELSIYQA